VPGDASAIKLVLFDVDGVLTDGTLIVHPDGTESKRFHIRDGAGLILAQRAGLLVGLLSARPSPATAARASQLGIEIVSKPGDDKLSSFESLLREHNLQDEQVAFMGDDLLDLPVLERVGFSAAPADAVEDVRSRVHWVSDAPGGQGAARELVERILRAKGQWDATVRRYTRRP